MVGPLPLYLGFLVLGLTVGYLFGSYQNWVIAYATPDQRPIFAGLFNTVAAVIWLIAPFIGGTIVQQIGYEALFVVALAMVLSALFVRNPRLEVAARGMAYRVEGLNPSTTA